ncbi:MAG: S-layer homology domain-containing protein [Caulobacteraceae bacterium]
MIVEKKKRCMIVRFALKIFLIIMPILCTGNIAANAGISTPGKNLISGLHPLPDNYGKREQVFNIITEPFSYKIKAISKDYTNFETETTPVGGAIVPPATSEITPAAPSPQSNPDGSASMTITALLNRETGTAAAYVSESILYQLLSLSKLQADGTKDISIAILKVDGATDYIVDLPTNVLAKLTDTEDITIKTEEANITLPSNMLNGDESVRNKNISLLIKKIDKSILSPEVQQRVIDKPVIFLAFIVDGVIKEYNNPDKPVTVSFNYKPTGAELLEPEFLVVWDIDNAGNLIEVPSGRYDAATGMVCFTTTHFDEYALVYNHKLFIDINNSHWAKETIEILASKGIARGTADRIFAPEGSITRGDYIAMLVKALGINTEINENFIDISITDANFKEIAVAKKLGITNGVGNNMFKPDDYISRQDLMVLTDRALTVAKKTKEKGILSDLDKFSDCREIAEYAKISVSNMVREGIILGNGKEIDPLSETTRAQAAAIVYRIYNKWK